MIICNKCGSDAGEKDVFCRSCGSKLELDNVICDEISSDDLKNENEVIKIQEENEEIPIEVKENANTDIKKSDRLMVFVFISAILIFIAGYIMNSYSYNSENTNGTIRQSFIKNYGNSLYYTYSKFTDTDTEENKNLSGIFKFTDKNTKSVKLTDGLGMFLIVKGSWIYYCDVNDGYKIYKVKKDGSDKTKINDEGGTNLTLKGNYLYYMKADDMNIDEFNKANSINLDKGLALYRMSINGSKPKKMAEDVFCYFISGEKVYYSTVAEPGILLSMSLNGNSKKEAVNVGGRILYFNDNYIYYLEPSIYNRERNNEAAMKIELLSGRGIVCRARIDGSQRSIVISDQVISVFVDENNIYYQSSGEPVGNIYRVNLYGENKKEYVVEGYPIEVTNNYIYYISRSYSKIYRMNVNSKKVEVIENDLY